MSDKFFPSSLPQLLTLIINQYDQTDFIFGIPKELFFQPEDDDTFNMTRFNKMLESPIGVAAGPHTQLSQNIVAAWLTGARFIELKTIQTLDDLEISKPCIDMQDEGYNCEWSQELKIHQSFDQYLDAWILIHILKDKLEIGNTEETGCIFNMSIGYNLEGILNKNVQWFLDKMQDASAELEQKLEAVKSIYPNVARLNISPKISDNVTLSTMHGCPPDEIEKIGAYLINERKLHTTIKLNPTLLGKEKLMGIFKLNGFDTQIPDIAFEHDLKYPDALKILNNLQKLAISNKVDFGLKLTNTLESKNHKTIFDGSQEMMYMSGRALHPVSVNLAKKLQNHFNGKLDISFSGGADAFNVVDLIKAGLAPVTVCTDLLKPGGYTRLAQYIGNLRKELLPTAENSSDFLNKYAKKVLEDIRYRKTYLRDISIKTEKELSAFDCIHAPCETTCPTNQDIPSYLHYVALGDFKEADRVVMQTNPFPLTTGMVCDHLCQTKCTRINYDSPVLIREVKRVIAEKSKKDSTQDYKSAAQTANKAAIVGAGPSGLSCAYFLRKAGFEVEVFESKPKSGGMVAGAIPEFRLTDEAYDYDLRKIEELGVKIHYQQKIDKERFEQFRKNFDFVYIAAGAQKSKPINLPGDDASGVLDPLDLLLDSKSGDKKALKSPVVIIGGGNTAMDAARTCWRLVGENSKVVIAYRRSIKDMPADLGEIKAVMEEGIEILEYVAPKNIITSNGEIAAVGLVKMKPGEKDASGRARPVEIQGSEFEIKTGTLVPAIGQDLDLDFLEEVKFPEPDKSYETSLPNVFVGGDALRGASTAINAIGDGRKAAQEIISRAGVDFNTKKKITRPEKNYREHIIQKANRQYPISVQELDVDHRKNFNLIQTPLTETEAITEAGRCLQCDEVCSVCSTVCPNMALFTYTASPFFMRAPKIMVEEGGAATFIKGFFGISQKYQILHIADWCNQCGNCNTFCPTSGAPYLEKPHLYLSKTSFEEAEDGFFVDGDKMLAKFANHRFTLENHGDEISVSNKNIRIGLSNEHPMMDTKVLSKNRFALDSGIAPFMKTIYEGAKQFFASNENVILT